MQKGNRSSKGFLWLCAFTCYAGTMLSATEGRAASWSPQVTLPGFFPIDNVLAFAGDRNGNQVWLSRPRATGGYVVQVASRSAGGSFGTPTTLSGVFTSLGSLTAAVSSNGTAAAGWATSNSIQISLRSTSGAWSAPVTLANVGRVLNLQLKLDAQGNGVMVWTRLTSTVAIVQALTWSSGGAFGAPVQLSSSSHGSFLPDLAINDAGSAVVVWQAAGLLDNSNPYQVESVSRPAGGAWSAPVVVSPVQNHTWTPQVAIDAAGNVAAIWEQGATAGDHKIFAATRAAGSLWSTPVRLDTGPSWAGGPNIAADAAGNFTAAWLIAGPNGNQVRSATRSGSGSFSAPTVLGTCTSPSASLCSRPDVAASADGSLTVVGWADQGSANAAKVATRLGLGAWTSTVLSPENTMQVLLVASDQASASALWTHPVTTGYNMVVKQSDYR